MKLEAVGLRREAFRHEAGGVKRDANASCLMLHASRLKEAIP
jgi:hypothetical protein